MARARITPPQLKLMLEKKLCSLTTPQAWQDLIASADRIGRYTARNRALALFQDPQATSLAGSGAWRSHGRQIPGGQRGLSLLAVTRSPGAGPWGRSEGADVLAPDLRPPHEQETAVQHEPEPVRYRGESGATVVKVWDVRQTVKITDCAACGSPADRACVDGCRGLPHYPQESVPGSDWWELAAELPEGVDPMPIWDALGEVVVLV